MTKDSELMCSAFGEYQLKRYPEPVGKGQQQSLRAWDAADEYLLHRFRELIQSGDVSRDSRVLIINDTFGALAVALHDFDPMTSSDSFLAHEGCRRNFQLNAIDPAQMIALDSFQVPEQAPDVVLIKVPKTLALLEDQLYRLREVIGDGCKVMGAGMVKHIHTSTLKLFESILGKTTTSLAKKKARLINCQPDRNIWQGHSPYPTEYILENTDYRITNHANVFSRASLDIGSRLFIQHLPSNFAGKDIIDLGCGNGLLGLIALEKNPGARVYFYDESYMALASARENIQRAYSDDRVKTEYIAANCLEGAEDNSADLILINPPFHQGNVVGDFIAWQMFVDAKRVMRPGGEVWVVGNRHMGYHLKLERLFGRCSTEASDAKFVVLKSLKS